MTIKPYTCDACSTVIVGDDIDSFVASLTDHVRTVHEWPYPDLAIRNFADATQRVDGPTERLEEIGEVTVEPVTGRLDDWLQFFDREAFAGNFAWASCYCHEPHCLDPNRREETDVDGRTWQYNRSSMEDLITSGRSFGYLAYVDGHGAGWVNASVKAEYALYRSNTPEDAETVGVACFVIAPPYRGHGLAQRLLDRVLADAPGREVRFVEAWPFKDEIRAQAIGDFRGHTQMYLDRGFEVVEERERDLVVRKRV
ncbi:MAG TPA: GNAT family N-acetyltransferase [Acidimicrobiales bacterium]|nr:GNAT family N-acetyltransferase [Acidimicrobiales bacterium]